MIRTEQQSKAQKGGGRGWGREGEGEGEGEGGWGRYQLRYIGEEYKPFI